MFIKLLITAFMLLGTAHASLGGNMHRFHDPVSGEWDITFSVAGQSASGTITLKVDGNKVTGTVNTAHTGPGTITDGKWDKGKLTCTAKFASHEDVVMSGELKDGKLVGEFQAEGNTGQWTATKHAAT
ncbi:MAG: hypothetical protein JO053_06720 [Acidobacteria bacterium]|nr:hypothetical protein [Acidobacteriota bacterium]